MEVAKYTILPPDNCKKLYYYDETLHFNAENSMHPTINVGSVVCFGQLGKCAVEWNELHH